MTFEDPATEETGELETPTRERQLNWSWVGTPEDVARGNSPSPLLPAIGMPLSGPLLG